MMNANPKNTTELAMVTDYKGTEDKTPEKTIDLQKFKQSLATKTDEKPTQQITWKEVKTLKNSGYFNLKDKYSLAYVLKNRKTGAIAEIQAASTVHACKFIGWRPHQVELLEVVNVKERAAKVTEQLEKYEKSNTEMASASSS